MLGPLYQIQFFNLDMNILLKKLISIIYMLLPLLLILLNILQELISTSHHQKNLYLEYNIRI